MTRLFFLFSFALIIIGSSIAYSLEVIPLVFQQEVNPGDSISIPVRLSSEIDQKVSLTLLKYIQREDGKQEFVEYEDTRSSVAKWFSFPDMVFLRAYVPTNIRVNVNIPYTAKGTYVSVIMVEPEEVGGVLGISIKIRFAILIVLRVSAPGLRQTYEIDEFEIVPGEEKEPVVTVKFHNNSLLDYFASIDASIRDPNGRTVEKLHLETGQSINRGLAQTWLIPDSKVTFSAKASKILVSGKYKVHLYINYGDRQRIVTKSFQIDREMFSMPEPKELYLLFDKPYVSLHLNPRSVKTELVSVTNKGGEPVDVNVDLLDISSNFENSLLSWVAVRGKDKFKLSPNKTSRTVLTFKVPSDAKEGAYYGKLVYTASKEATPIISRELLLSVVIGKPTVSATLLGIGLERDEEKEMLLSVLLKNDGKVHFSELSGTFEMIKPGEIVSTLSGELEPSREGWILPEEKIIMTSILKSILEAGNYALILKIYDAEELILQVSAEISIGNEKVEKNE
ncbi:hypothetical protein [Kosmotoga pacifica]|uniref:Uncharacterized protein n=1 Tax=Kosmotoga pacifica TaxID=1330330 RepID=A0A0G2ZBQ0_9BACT|nr:hypothetical protein [Kosmotoga pacifica]AKI97501.1 hypothetical protein IX53_06360 [Kosmotoga pacifica]